MSNAEGSTVVKEVAHANPGDRWGADPDQPMSKAPLPFAAPCPPERLASGDLSISTIAEHEIQTQDKKPATSSVITARDNLRPPVSSVRHGPSSAASKPPVTSTFGAASRKTINSISASPVGHTGTGSHSGKTPTVRRVGSMGHTTPSSGMPGARAVKTPGVGRSGSSVASVSRPPPSKYAATTIKKPPAATPNASMMMMNESVMSFIPSGEVDAEGNQLSKTEEERLRMEIEVAYCRAMQYQIMRAKLRRAAEAQSRDVISQLGALWEETQRLRESAAEKRSEAADIRRQRELHLATKLGGAGNICDEDKTDTPTAPIGTGSTRRLKSKPNSGNKNSENVEQNPDLRSVCELLGPTMKDLSMLAGSLDKTRHGLPMKDVVNASPRQLAGALHYFEGALVDMPRMAKMAISSSAPSEAGTTPSGEAIKSFRESTESLGRECLETVDVLQMGGEMACHMLALEECSRLKASSNDWTSLKH